ncbi:MAG TPA: hypothetical protein VMV72_01175 [Verrucomicrobiae bacterium]|nr:hypothetical protein [Verrucomicrobiae bacterium]
MDKTTATVIVAGIFALALVIVLLSYRRKGKGKITGPFGMKLEVEGANDTPQTPGVNVENAKSRTGGLSAEDHTGKGANVKGVDVDKDIRVTSSPPSRGPSPPKR